MKKKTQKEKLSFEKFTVCSLDNLISIKGGIGDGNGGIVTDPNGGIVINAPKPVPNP